MSRKAVEFRPVEPADITWLAEHLRAQDVAEVHACGHRDLAHVVRAGVARSVWSRTATVDGEVAAIFGVAPLLTLMDPRGVPWMLGTDLVPANRGALARHAAPYIQQMLGTFPHLVNIVHAKNTVAVRWLRRVGFTLREPIPHGPEGEMFHLFEMHRHV